MAFKTVVCWYCKYPNEFYQVRSIVPACPKCGAGCNGSQPIIPNHGGTNVSRIV